MSKFEVIKTLPRRIEAFFSVFSYNESMAFDHAISIAAIIKNEASYIEEWIEYHLLVGINHFYLFDNGSTDQTSLILEPYVKKGIVTLISFPGRGRQLEAYNEAISKYKYETKWMAFIDADEFIAIGESYNCIQDVVELLIGSNQKAGGLAINWRMFGSSGHKVKPNSGVLDSFRFYGKPGSPGTECIKTIVNPRSVVSWVHCHFPIYRIGCYSVDAYGRKVRGWRNPQGPDDIVRICHYFTKSEEEWVERRANGKADKKDNIDNRSFREFIIHDNNDIEDLQMQKYARILKENKLVNGEK